MMATRKKISARTTPPQIDDAVTALLRGLPHTGERGFEGLVAHMLAHQLQQRFRLAASGFQQGMDAQAEPGPSSVNTVKVETKHYFKSSLDLRELTAEIVQACRDDRCDLWILASTCPASTQIADHLEEIAAEYGAECLFLDRSGPGLNRLFVLFALQEDAFVGWAQGSGAAFDEQAVRGQLSAVRAAPGYPMLRDTLVRKLTSTCVGYDDTRRRSREKLLSTLQDCSATEALFNQDVAVLATQGKMIPRASVSRALTNWWRGGAPQTFHCAVLGEEGQGKTWALFGWLNEQLNSRDMPLLLACNASTATIHHDENVEQLLPRLLQTWSGMKTDAWWQQRLDHWVAGPALTPPRILLVMDGLNENTDVNWTRFFQPLLLRKWRGQVSVVITDRTLHWRDQRGLQQDGFTPLTVAGYSPEELRHALAGRRIDVSDIPQELHEFLRTPRYCSMVAQHFEELKASGDFSRERLILLDAAHRTSRRGSPMSESEFMEVIRTLAERHLQNPALSETALDQLLPGAQDWRRVLQEIKDGGLLVPVMHGAIRRYEVESTRLIFGLGMVLVERLSELSGRGLSAAAVREEIGRSLEPHPEMDLKVQICASAAYYSYLDARLDSVCRQELLKFWLTARNGWEDGDKARLSLILKGPQEFIAVAESIWADAHQRGHAKELLSEAFCTYRDHDAVRLHLQEAVARWMGFVQPAGPPLLRGLDADTRQRKVAELQERAGKELAPGPLDFLGTRLTVVEAEGSLRLARLGLRIISVGSRTPYVRALVNWAAASALMGGTLEEGEVAWVLRLSKEPIDSLLLQAAEQFLQGPSEDSHRAGRLLVYGCGTALAHALMARYPNAESPERLAALQEHRANPCKSYYAWSNEECERCLNHPDTSVHDLMRRARLKLLNPEQPVHERVATHARAALAAMDPMGMRSTLSTTETDLNLDRIQPFAAVHAPQHLAGVVRAAIRTMPARDLEAQRYLSFQLWRFIPLLGEAEKDALRNTQRALREGADAWSLDSIENSAQIAEAYVTGALLPLLSPDGRWDEILDRPQHAADLDAFADWFDTPSPAKVLDAFAALQGQPATVASRRLLWLIGSSAQDLADQQRELLMQFWNDPDEVIQGMVARCAVLLKDEVLAKSLLAVPRAITNETHPWQAHWLFALLRGFSDCLAFEVVLHRVNPALASFILASRGCRPAESRLYASCTDTWWNQTVRANDAAEHVDLPTVDVDASYDRDPTRPPKLVHDTEVGLLFKDASTSWKDSDQFLRESQDPDTQFERMQERERAARDAIAAAWSTEAFSFFGRPFSVKALRAVSERTPGWAQRFLSEASLPGIEGRRIRARTGTFLAAVCEAVTPANPVLGLRFLELHLGQDAYVQVDPTSFLMRLPRGPEIDQAREQLCGRIGSDKELARFARLAQMADDGWLNDIVAALVDSPHLADKARGLAIASLSSMSEVHFQHLVQRSAIQGTWVEKGCLETFSKNRVSDELASKWYARFVSEADDVKSWCALQAALDLADGRWWIWAKGAEGARRKFLEYIVQDIDRKVEDPKDRKDTLFGIKVPIGEIFPF